METLFPKKTKKMENKMDTKKLFVSFVVLVSVLLLASIVGASHTTSSLGTLTEVEVDGVDVGDSPAIVVGELVDFRIEFTSDVYASDVTVEVEVEGDRKDVRAETRPFDVEPNQSYARTLRLDIPFDLRDDLSDFVTLNVDISGDGFEIKESFTLRIQRESYSADVLAISVPQTAKAGELFPVDVVVKNIGYNDLDDLFVIARIPSLNVERTAFFGDIVALECDDRKDSIENYGIDIDRRCDEDEEDTVTGRLFLQLPYGVQSGTYALEVTVENEDTVSSQTVQVSVRNAFSSGTLIASGNQLLIVNPTNEVVVYRLIPESTDAVTVSVSESVVAVPAGSSKTVTVQATSNVEGAQTYNVNVFSADGALVDTVSFTTTGREAASTTSPIVVLTIILAIIFVVLLVVLIVLIGKKPEKSEEFGESYY